MREIVDSIVGALLFVIIFFGTIAACTRMTFLRS